MDKQAPVQIEKINGLADEKAACGIFTKRVTFESGVVATLLSTILVHGNEGEDNQTYLKDMFEISAGKLEDSTGKPLAVLKDANEACSSYIKQRNLDVSFVNALIYKNAFYFVRFGEEVKIFVFKKGNSLELKFEYGSGLLYGAEIFLIGTTKFFETFDTSVLSSDASVDLAGIIDGLATEISADEAQSEIGVSIVYVKDEEEPENESEKEDGEGLGEKVNEVGKTEETSLESGEEDKHVSEERVSETVATAVSSGKVHTAGGGLIRKLWLVLASLAGAFWAEVKKLKKGDVRAILRLRRNIVFVAVLVLVILGISAFVSIRSQKNKEIFTQFNDHMKNASTKLAEGEAILGLNRDSARTSFAEADKEVKAALLLEPGNSDAKALSDKISQDLKNTESVSALNFATFADVGEPLVSISLSQSGMVGFSKDKMYQVDSNGKVTDTNGTASNVESGFFYNDSGFVVSGNIVYKIGFGNSKAQNVASADGISDIAVFLGNIYLLEGNQIAKYVPIESGYAKSVDYLNNPEQFSPNSRFAIDGSVWVTNGSEIDKYTRGAKEDFSISGLTDSNGKFGEIYTNSDINNLYVLDISNSALLVISKDGVYQKAYQSGEFAKATSIMVDESGQKMYIAEGSKILEAGL